MNRMSVEELSERGQALTDLVLIDVREPWEFQIGHLPGSKNIPLQNIPTFLETEDKGRTYLFICHHGIRSARATAYADSQGFADVWNLSGGVAAWAQKVDPNFPTY